MVKVGKLEPLDNSKWLKSPVRAADIPVEETPSNLNSSHCTLFNANWVRGKTCMLPVLHDYNTRRKKYGQASHVCLFVFLQQETLQFMATACSRIPLLEGRKLATIKGTIDQCFLCTTSNKTKQKDKKNKMASAKGHHCE